MPYLGRTAAADNLLVATGHAMMGLSLAPVTGAIVARLSTASPRASTCTCSIPTASPDFFQWSVPAK